jgi:protein-S-isoprenylcysteine O-methyltransferase Ste14
MSLYRLASPASSTRNVIKTLAMVAAFTAVVIWIIPDALVTLQRTSGDFDALFFPPQLPLGIAVLAAGTVLVLWGGLALALRGAGTPISLDAPRHLVINGPYAWLRTPMVTGATVQGGGVGLIHGSILVLIFFAAMALFWNSFVRPGEEHHLQGLFGRDFELYRRSVRCWLPMRSPWGGPAGDVPPITLAETPDPGRRRRRKGRP